MISRQHFLLLHLLSCMHASMHAHGRRKYFFTSHALPLSSPSLHLANSIPSFLLFLFFLSHTCSGETSFHCIAPLSLSQAYMEEIFSHGERISPTVFFSHSSLIPLSVFFLPLILMPGIPLVCPSSLLLSLTKFLSLFLPLLLLLLSHISHSHFSIVSLSLSLSLFCLMCYCQKRREEIRERREDKENNLGAIKTLFWLTKAVLLAHNYRWLMKN